MSNQFIEKRFGQVVRIAETPGKERAFALFHNASLFMPVNLWLLNFLLSSSGCLFCGDARRFARRCRPRCPAPPARR